MNWLEVADGVLVRRHQELDLTVGLVRGDGECLVIDTRGDLEQGRELAAAVRSVTRDPITVALTHAHFDHCLGTAALAPVTVLAHERCRAALAGGVVSRKAAEWYQRHEAPELGARAKTVTPVLPDQLLTDRLDLSVGGRPVRLCHPGPGHTDHDVVVTVPDARVTFAGDLLEEGAPPDFEDADPVAWPAAVDALLRLPAAEVLVPGHGAPVTPEFAAVQRDELATLAGLCRDVLDGGRDVAGVLAASPFPAETTRDALARLPGTES